MHANDFRERQVTLPKRVLKAAGLEPGDNIEFGFPPTGGISISKAGAYKARLYTLAKRRIIRDGMTTDEFMKMLRGDPADDPPLKE